MKTFAIIFILIPSATIAAPISLKNKNYDRLEMRVRESVGDISFELELQWPDRVTAWALAYEECGNKEVDEFFPAFDEYGEEYGNIPSGYKTKNYYTEFGRDVYVYKCR